MWAATRHCRPGVPPGEGAAAKTSLYMGLLPPMSLSSRVTVNHLQCHTAPWNIDEWYAVVFCPSWSPAWRPKWKSPGRGRGKALPSLLHDGWVRRWGKWAKPILKNLPGATCARLGEVWLANLVMKGLVSRRYRITNGVPYRGPEQYNAWHQ